MQERERERYESRDRERERGGGREQAMRLSPLEGEKKNIYTYMHAETGKTSLLARGGKPHSERDDRWIRR